MNILNEALNLYYILGTAALIFMTLYLRALFKLKELKYYLYDEKQKTLHLQGVEEEVKNLQAKYFDIKLYAVALEEKVNFHKEAQESLKESFKALSSEVLEESSKSFLERAKASFEHFQESAKGEFEKKEIVFNELLKPVKESLAKLDEGMKNIEVERRGDRESLKEQIKALAESEKQLRQETATLVRALRSPSARGRWGELQLKRVVEIAGMLEHCDFMQQVTLDDDSNKQRPDLVIHLSGGRNIVIDAKTPLEAFLDAMGADNDELKIQKFKDHARHVKEHVQDLSKKSYWEKLDTTPEFVVMFLPSETIFSAALEQDPSLIELGADHKVILATPTTLIALLRAVAYGWKQEKLSRKAEEISQLGIDLYKRLSDLSSHFVRMGKSLTSSVEAYNKAVGCLETRVLVSARRFEQMGIGSNSIEIEQLETLAAMPRPLASKEILSVEEEV